MRHPGKIVVDLDGALAGPKPASGTYLDCEVNGPLADRLRELKRLGWTIAIYTSRNVKSHEHNLGKIVATTMADIATWLTAHRVPYDELWPSKPWTGEIGFYVDDRAVRPSEFLKLTTSELLNQARSEAFNYGEHRWHNSPQQEWITLDARLNPLVTDDVARLEAAREEGRRAVILIGETAIIPVGFDEELQRLGAIYRRFSAQLPLANCLFAVTRELELEGAVEARSGHVKYQSRHEPFTNILSSRHFNSVVREGDFVHKKSSESMQQKLFLEYSWLNKMSSILPKYIPSVKLAGSGYLIQYQEGGSLAQTLMRQDLTPYDIRVLAEALARMWRDLGAETTGDLKRIKEAHTDLIERKSLARVKDLDALLLRLAGVHTDTPWVVNGELLGTIYNVVKWLIQQVPAPTYVDRGYWHGDLCPGNILLAKPITDDGPVDLKLIDPRGTVDGETPTSVGDRRYDLAKLGHALRWGYDALAENWFDCAWSPQADKELTLNVQLRVWDEDTWDRAKPSRYQLWYELTRLNVGQGDVKLDSPVIHALTALQLITCAPLHADRPKRVFALIARGLQVAVAAGYSPEE